jgi:tetratricopeptide (TPR) repeat protein
LSTEPDGDAAALFGQRAAAAGAAWASDAEVRDRVAAVCEAVGGLALAVELAAARLPSMGLDGVERALGNQRGLLAGATRAAERHRSMEDALDWSVALLDQNTATVFRRIAVLVAPFDASAAAVAAFAPLGETDVALALAQLADHSLLDARATGTRLHYRMLEPVRQYAISHLTEQDKAVFNRHLAWCREQAELALADDSDDVSIAFADDARAALARAAAAATPDAVAVAHLARALGLVLFRSGSLREAQERLEQAASFSPERDSARDLSDAAAVAHCRQLGEEALRLKLKAAERHGAAGDPDAYAVALAGASEYVGRFEGMFAATPVATGPDLLDRARESATGDLQTQAAITLAGCACHATDQWPSIDDALSALEIARRHGDTVQQSAAMDGLTVALAAAGKMVEASRTAQERLALLDGRGWQPAVIAELFDALHMAVATSAGAGDLPSARTAAARNATLPIWRDRPDDAAEMLILPAALSGDWETARAAAERFLRGWNLAGRLPKPGAAWYPAAAALAFGLSGDDERYDQWRDITATMRRAPAGVSWFGTGYGELFEAMVLLDRGAPQAALDVLLTDRDLGLGGIVFAQWLPAVTAEAAALSAAASASDRVACARTKAAGNPIAEAITERAEAILARDPARLAEIATRLERAGSPYQAARTRRLQRGLASRM